LTVYHVGFGWLVLAIPDHLSDEGVEKLHKGPQMGHLPKSGSWVKDKKGKDGLFTSVSSPHRDGPDFRGQRQTTHPKFYTKGQDRRA